MKDSPASKSVPTGRALQSEEKTASRRKIQHPLAKVAGVRDIVINVDTGSKQDKPVTQVKPITKTFSSLWNSVTQILGSVTSLYVIPGFNFWWFKTQPVVNDVPFSFWLPHWIRVDYALKSVKVEGKKKPYLNVRFCEYWWGRMLYERFGDIEPELLTKCFSQSTVRDYYTLVNSIFMTVSRGMREEDVVCHDVNLKLECIAYLYCFLHPERQEFSSGVKRVLGSYRPLVPGFYAMGSERAPEFGDPDFDITWKRERPMVSQQYVARLLLPELEDKIPPLFIPARTIKEYIKGFGKRMRRHAMKDMNDFGLHYTVDDVRHTVDQAVQHFLQHHDARMRRIKQLTKEEIIDECVRKANKRFQSPADRASYIEGATIALYEHHTSHQFKRMIDLCVEIGIFIKDECYDKLTPVRYIMCPCIKARGFCHALLMNSQLLLFGDEENRNFECVKHMTEQERTEYVVDLFGSEPVAVGDISSMESCVNEFYMTHVEYPIFSHLIQDNEIKFKIGELWHAYTSRPYHVSNSEFEFMLRPMRLSGQEHTSAGNYVVNFVWILTIIKLLTGHFPDLDHWAILVEGDDSIFSPHVPLDDGTHYDLNPISYKAVADTIGTIQKLETYSSVTEASFCGIKLKPGLREKFDGTIIGDDMLAYETDFVLSRVLWKVGYDRMTAKHDLEILFATVLSYLPRAVGNPRLYQCLIYLAQRCQSISTKSNYFKQVWFRTFYKGDVDAVPEIPCDLKQYCQNMDIPYIKVRGVPDEFLEYHSNKWGMFVEKVGPEQTLTLTGFFKYLIGYKTYQGFQMLSNEPNECMIHCLYELGHWQGWHDKTQLTYDAFKQQRGLQGAVTLTQAIHSLNPGEYIVADLGRECFKYENWNGVIHKEQANPHCGFILDMSFPEFPGLPAHACLIHRGPDPNEDVRAVEDIPVNGIEDWPFLILFCLILLVLLFYMFSMLMTRASLFGIALYPAYLLILGFCKYWSLPTMWLDSLWEGIVFVRYFKPVMFTLIGFFILVLFSRRNPGRLSALMRFLFGRLAPLSRILDWIDLKLMRLIGGYRFLLYPIVIFLIVIMFL